MKKRVSVIFFALFLAVIQAVPVAAAGSMPRLVDEADLLSDREEAALLGKLDEISERQKLDIAVVTVDSLEGASAMDFADDFYDYNGYGFGDSRDGILFLISMEERDWHLSTRGYGITAFTDAGMDYMFETFRSDLSAGKYAAAFTTFAELCDDFITQARTGKPFDADNLPKEPFSIAANLVCALLIGFVISLIVTGVMRHQLRTVYSQSRADSYMKKDSMRLTEASDLFLYRHVDRRERPKENTSSGSSIGSGGFRGSTTHRSSSGARHGGRGGKF